MSFNVLPPEIREKIFSYLDTLSLMKAAKVCSMWRNNISSNRTNIGYMPRIVATIFRHLDHHTLLTARRVCSLWRQGLDKMTEEGAISFPSQSLLSSDFAQSLLERKEKPDNPFPSRTARMSLTLNEGKNRGKRYAVKTEAIRYFGHHIRFLNIKLITCSLKEKAMLNVVKNIVVMLCHLSNLEGLSVYISFVFDNDNCRFSTAGFEDAACVVSNPNKWRALDREFPLPLMTKLRAFRLVAWNSSSPETEWLYYKILRHAPSLEFFDPDFCMGYEKFYRIFSQPQTWPFKLKCLKLALSGKVCQEAFQLMKEAKFPLTSIYLDIFEYNYVKNSNCAKVIRVLLKSCETTLRTLSLSFYKTCESIPSPTVEILGPSSHFLRNFVASHHQQNGCMSGLWGKGAHLLSHGGKETCFAKLENLKLRGFKGSLGFLREFKNLKKLILLDYSPIDQPLFKCENDFYKHIPSLTELYTPFFGTLNVRGVKGKLVDEEYLPIYW